MKKGGKMYRSLCLFATAVVLLGGCSDDSNPTQSTPEGLASIAGTWNLHSWVYSRDDNPAQTVDWVSLLGLSGTLVIAGSGEFSVSPALPGGFGQDHGDLTMEADSLYWDGENDEEWVHFTLGTDLLTLEWPEVELVDMDQDGTPEDVWLVVTYEK